MYNNIKSKVINNGNNGDHFKLDEELDRVVPY